MEYKFYMVWVEGKPAPTKKHYDKEAAVAEAKRLAEKEMKAAYVLESEESYRPTLHIATEYIYQNAPEGYTGEEPCSE